MMWNNLKTFKEMGKPTSDILVQLFCCLFFCLSLSSCGARGNASAAGGGTVDGSDTAASALSREAAADGEGLPLLAVTIEPLRYFTEALAGSRFRVVSLVPRGSSPETYDPTPRQLVDFSRSRAYLRIGYIGFEQVWAERLAGNAPQVAVFDTSQGVELIRDEAHHHASHSHEAHHSHAPHSSEGVEPHIWNSATNARIIARNILQALSTLDTAGTALYRARYDSLCRRIDRTDSLVRATLARPAASRAFLIYHPALSYFAREYGLRQIPVEVAGKEPSPAQLEQLVRLCRELQVRVAFVQPEFDRRNAQLVADHVGARVVDINPLAYDWEAEMLRTAEALAVDN